MPARASTASDRGAPTRVRRRIAAGFSAPLHRDLALMILAFTLLRIFAVEGQGGAVRYSDSGTYFAVDFLGGAQRLWTVPLLYNLVPGDTLKVVAQVAVGIACWGALAWVVAGLPRHAGVARAAAAGVLVLGLTKQVTQWDLVILSESLGVSLTVLAIAALLLVSRRASPATLAFALAAVTLWMFTRHVNVIVLLVAVPFGLLFAFRGLSRRHAAVFGVGLLVIAVWGAASLTRESDIWKLNSFSIIAERMLADPEATAFLEERGLEVTPELLRERTDSRGAASPAFTEPSMQRFLEEDWRGAYPAYLIRHPLGTVRKPLEDASNLMSSDAALAAPRPVLPEPVQSLAFGVTPGDLPFLFVIALGAQAAAWVRRRRPTTADAMAVGLLVLAGVWLGLVWHLSAFELSRLTVPVAVATRVALLLLLVLAVDRLLRRRDIS